MDRRSFEQISKTTINIVSKLTPVIIMPTFLLFMYAAIMLTIYNLIYWMVRSNPSFIQWIIPAILLVIGIFGTLISINTLNQVMMLA